MCRVKVTARKSTGGKAPRKLLSPTKAAALSSIVATIVKAPAVPTYAPGRKAVFLGGTLGMGTDAVDWREEVIAGLACYRLTLLNPRRADWDEDDACAQYRELRAWAYEAQENADVTVAHFNAATADEDALDSLLDFALFARNDQVVVCCDEDYRFAQKVKAICIECNIKQVDIVEDLVDEVVGMLRLRK